MTEIRIATVNYGKGEHDLEVTYCNMCPHKKIRVHTASFKESNCQVTGKILVNSKLHMIDCDCELPLKKEVK